MSNNDRFCILCKRTTIKNIIGLVDDRYGCPGQFDIEYCSNCDHSSTSPKLAESEVPKLYESYYPRGVVNFDDIDREASENSAKYSWLRRWINGTNNQGQFFASKGQKVLDIGCGSCNALLDLRNIGATAYGVEADPNVEEIAEHYDLNVHIGDISENPFPEVQFDLIIMNQVIEHLPDPECALKFVTQRLSENGKVVLSFPNAGSIYRKLSGRKWINWHVPYHQQFFTLKSISILAKRVGLKVEKTSTITPNIWTVLQYRNMFNKDEEGSASQLWSDVGNNQNNFSFSKKLKNKINKIFTRLLYPTIVIVNRVMDFLNKGDCLVIILKADIKSKM